MIKVIVKLKDGSQITKELHNDVKPDVLYIRLNPPVRNEHGTLEHPESVPHIKCDLHEDGHYEETSRKS